jgi:hypothetical protein
LKGHGHEQQPCQYGAQRASHAAESKAGKFQSCREAEKMTGESHLSY